GRQVTVSGVALSGAVVTGTATINAASEVGNTVTITTALAHGFTAGQQVAISGVNVAGYNGVFTLLTAAGTTFTYFNPVSGLGGAGVGGNATTGATEVGNTVTIGTTAAHGLLPGQQVLVSGVAFGSPALFA